MRAHRWIERIQILARSSDGEHDRQLQRLQILEQPPARVLRPDRRIDRTPPRTTAPHLPRNRTAAARAAMPNPIIASLELPMPRGELAHAVPAVSAASAADRQRRSYDGRHRSPPRPLGRLGPADRATPARTRGIERLLPQHPRPRLGKGRARRPVVDDTRPAIDPDDLTDHAASGSSSSAAATSRMTIATAVKAVAAARCSPPPTSASRSAWDRRAPRSRAPSRPDDQLPPFASLRS